MPWRALYDQMREVRAAAAPIRAAAAVPLRNATTALCARRHAAHALRRSRCNGCRLNSWRVVEIGVWLVESSYLAVLAVKDYAFCERFRPIRGLAIL
jgi:hypothetical protein